MNVFAMFRHRVTRYFMQVVVLCACVLSVDAYGLTTTGSIKTRAGLEFLHNGVNRWPMPYSKAIRPASGTVRRNEILEFGAPIIRTDTFSVYFYTGRPVWSPSKPEIGAYVEQASSSSPYTALPFFQDNPGETVFWWTQLRLADATGIVNEQASTFPSSEWEAGNNVRVIPSCEATALITMSNVNEPEFTANAPRPYLYYSFPHSARDNENKGNDKVALQAFVGTYRNTAMVISQEASTTTHTHSQAISSRVGQLESEYLFTGLVREHSILDFLETGIAYSPEVWRIASAEPEPLVKSPGTNNSGPFSSRGYWMGSTNVGWVLVNDYRGIDTYGLGPGSAYGGGHQVVCLITFIKMA